MKRQEQLTCMLTQMRVRGMMLTTSTQSADIFKGSVRRRRPAFDDWLHQLSRPGKPLIITDEFWQQFS